MYQIKIQVPMLVEDSLVIEVEDEQKVTITAELQDMEADGLLYSNEAERLSVLVPLPSKVLEGEAEYGFNHGILTIEVTKKPVEVLRQLIPTINTNDVIHKYARKKNTIDVEGYLEYLDEIEAVFNETKKPASEAQAKDICAKVAARRRLVVLGNEIDLLQCALLATAFNSATQATSKDKFTDQMITLALHSSIAPTLTVFSVVFGNRFQSAVTADRVYGDSTLGNCPPLLPLNKDTGSLSSITTTTPKYPRTDLDTLATWHTFPTEIDSVRHILRNSMVPSSTTLGPFDFGADVNDETDVHSIIRQVMFVSLKKCLSSLDVVQPKFTVAAGNKDVVGQPDSLYKSGSSTKPKIVVEVKTDWAFPQLGCIVAEWPAAQRNPKSKLARVIHQVYGYMTFNHLRYGVLTNYEKTWFLRRVDVPQGGQLEISDPFAYSSTSTLFQAWVTITLLAENNWFYSSPTTSPCATSLSAPPAPAPTSDPRIGVVVHGTYYGTSVAMKVVDASKEQWASEELDHEVSVYSALRSLSGSTIPRVIAYIEVRDMLRILVLEDCGINLRAYQKQGGNLSTVRHLCNVRLAELNAFGYMHNDVKEENFMFDSGFVRLIDLGQASQGTASESVNF
ncbi:hypothetical protein HDU88_006568 [Geranomyces variabilis]|nr:hypothetical protein HDU88_006568 [Geranomyces variabilis]